MAATKRKRKKLSTSVRFEVFKRDSFTCQYCGRKAPEVVLELEHIDPVSKGGGDEVLNLITSCWECNSGKSDRKLDDSTVVAKQHAQLAELQERREQLEMMLRWREGAINIKEASIDAAAKAWTKRAIGWDLNETGLQSIRKLVAKNGLDRVLVAIDRACDMYLQFSGKQATKDSVDHAFRMVFIFSQPDDIQILYRCRGIVRKRCPNADPVAVMELLRTAAGAGASHDDLLALSTHPSCRSWPAWRNAMNEFIYRLRES